MARLVLFVSLFFGFVLHAGASSIVRIADGDCAALNSAVSSASTDGDTTIILARGGHYFTYGATQACAILVHRGRVVVEGAGAEIQPACLSYVVGVDAGASLTLRNVLIDGPSCGFVPPLRNAISSSGELQLEGVTTGQFIYNNAHATMALRNATLAGAITNDGSLDMLNSTLLGIASIGNAAGERFVVANSILQTA